jgi:hypothetical protein
VEGVTSFVVVKTIPWSRLEANSRGTLHDGADSGQAIVVELPDSRLVALWPRDPAQDDPRVRAD